MRQRAVICQDCWFWKEMSCALANPEGAVCANRRPVRGRGVTPQQPARLEPFATDAPESTFSVTQVRSDVATPPRVAAEAVHTAPQLVLAQPLATSLPSAREIRAGRAAAASRMPEPEVRIAVTELDSQLEIAPIGAPQRAAHSVVGQGGAGLDQLVERVRRRTAARMSRAAVPQ